MSDLSALWNVADLPRLPPHAPSTIYPFVVEVKDPSKIYTIHRGRRRHELGLLVERFIHQLRYGCNDDDCSTPTCFSCRRRIAGNRPIRRFNSTSARALAVQLAGQDHPLRQLCPAVRDGRCADTTESSHPPPFKSVRKSKPTASRPSTPNTISARDEDQADTLRLRLSLERKNSGIQQEHVSYGAYSTTKPSVVEERSQPSHAGLSVLHRSNKIDSKSFVQNLFDTTAFKLLEWLTPANFEGLSTDVRDMHISPDADDNLPGSGSTVKVTKQSKLINDLPSSREYDFGHDVRSEAPRSVQHSSQSPLLADAVPSSTANLKGNMQAMVWNEVDTRGVETSSQTTTSPALRGPRAVPLQTAAGKPSETTYQNGVTVPLQPRSKSRPSELPAVPHSPKSTRNQVATALSPDTIHELSFAPGYDGAMTGCAECVTPESVRHGDLSPASQKTKSPPSLNGIRSGRITQFSGSNLGPDSKLRASFSRPGQQAQSLSCLNRDVLKILWNLAPHTIEFELRSCFVSLDHRALPPSLGSDPPNNTNSSSFHSLVLGPYNTLTNSAIDDNRILLHQVSSTPAHSDPHAKLLVTEAEPIVEDEQQYAIDDHMVSENSQTPQFKDSNTLEESLERHLWAAFLDQSLFYVLSDPGRLLLSFTEDAVGGFSPCDSQLTYHSMKMLLQINRDVVLDSLWLVAAHAFLPPPELENVNWKTRSTRQSGGGFRSCSEAKASAIIQLCLHALVAAMPTVDDWNDSYIASKIRSEGKTMPQTWGWKEHMKVSVAYDDVFSDSMAMRLAKRVFSAISVRSQFRELQRGTADVPTADDNGEHAHLVSLVLSRLLHGKNDRKIEAMFTQESRDLYYRVAPGLLYDWAFTTINSEWDGSPIIAADSALGGALSVINTLYLKRVELSVVDGYFVAVAFENRLENLQIPVAWLSFTPSPKEIHLLDYPYLFSANSRNKFFRTINFHRMSHAYETSAMMENNIALVSSPGLLMTDRARRDHLDKCLGKALDPFLVLQIRRSHILEDTFDQLWRREDRELARPLKVRLGESSGELGFDSGGVQQEFVRLAVAEVLNPDYGVFTVDERNRMAWFQPGSPEPLWKFELIGLIFSVAIYNGLTLPVTFPMAMYANLLGKTSNNINHIVDGWPELARSLEVLLEWNEQELGSIADVLCRTYEFSVPLFGETVSREMVQGQEWPEYRDVIRPLNSTGEKSRVPHNPDVRLVDIYNRDEFVVDYIKWLTDVSVRPQFEAFKKGFLTCIHPKSLTLFTPPMLSNIVEGQQDISVTELRHYTRYEGYCHLDPYINDFWDVVKEYDDAELKKLLEFVTASQRLPAGGMPQITFVISKNGEQEMDGHLPTAYTCYGTLLLPMYSSKEILKQKLGMAIQNAQGFGFA